MRLAYQIRTVFSCVLFASLLVGCGGGDGSTSSTTPMTQTSAQTFVSFQLPATGISASQCYDSLYVLGYCAGLSDLQGLQDGDLVQAADTAVHTMSYSSPTAANGDNTQCVFDNNTGLTWEGKTFYYRDFRATNKLFTNVGAGNRGSTASSPSDAADYVTYINNLNGGAGLCGYTDWRMPTVQELQTIVDYGSTNYAKVNFAWFPNTSARPYWGSSTSLYLNFGTGEVNSYPLPNVAAVRLVRSATSSPIAPSYSYSADDSEVIDATTGLTWLRCPLGLTWNVSGCAGIVNTGYMTQTNALLQASNATQSTYGTSKWRLPNVKEISSIVEWTASVAKINQTAFPSTPASIFWTSSPNISNPMNVWGIYFSTGSVLGQFNPSSKGFVRLVRDTTPTPSS